MHEGIPTGLSAKRLETARERVVVADEAKAVGALLGRALAGTFELQWVGGLGEALSAAPGAAVIVVGEGLLGAEGTGGAGVFDRQLREVAPHVQVLVLGRGGEVPALSVSRGMQGLPLLQEAVLVGVVLAAAELSRLRASNARLSRTVGGAIRLPGPTDNSGWAETFDSLDLPISVVDAEYTISRANAAYARAGGRNGMLLAEHPRCHAFLFGREEPCVGCPLKGALAQGREGRAEISHQERTYALAVYPMDAGHAVCSYRDVTEEQALNRRLMHSEKMAAVGRLAGGVAHEINNPLGGILAFSQLMQRDPGRSAEDMESLSLIEESALRCKRIVESLLRFARASRGEDRRPFNLSRCVEDAAILFRAQMKGAPRARLELSLRDGLPEVVGDPARLAQVVLNLLQNGLDSLPRDEGTLTLSTGELSTGEGPAGGKDGRVYFRVQDTGEGIAARDLPHIFEPHFTTRAPGAGTGLGLSIAYRIVEDHGGTFEVETTPGQGSTFTVTLPVPPITHS